jgi:hypothetical protein
MDLATPIKRAASSTPTDIGAKELFGFIERPLLFHDPTAVAFGPHFVLACIQCCA